MIRFNHPARSFGLDTLRRCLLVLAGCAVVLAAPARADDSVSPAKKAFEEANAEYALGHYEIALAKFEEAFRLTQKGAILFNIAQCHRQLKQFEQASTTYRSFLRLEPGHARSKDAKRLLAEVDAALKSADKAQATRPLELGKAPAGLDVANAKPRPAPQATPSVAPAATAVAAKPVSTRPAAELLGDTNRPILVSAKPPARAQEPQGRTFTWIAAGAAGVALAGGAVFGLQARSTASQLSGSEHPRAQTDQLQTSLQSQSQKANLLFVAGAGLAAVSAAFFILHF